MVLIESKHPLITRTIIDTKSATDRRAENQERIASYTYKVRKFLACSRRWFYCLKDNTRLLPFQLSMFDCEEEAISTSRTVTTPTTQRGGVKQIIRLKRSNVIGIGIFAKIKQKHVPKGAACSNILLHMLTKFVRPLRFDCSEEGPRFEV